MPVKNGLSYEVSPVPRTDTGVSSLADSGLKDVIALRELGKIDL